MVESLKTVKSFPAARVTAWALPARSNCYFLLLVFRAAGFDFAVTTDPMPSEMSFFSSHNGVTLPGSESISAMVVSRKTFSVAAIALSRRRCRGQRLVPCD